ncbi:2Fe-2S iron-sulfur cluster-binding protein [Mesorhizobium sp. M0047]|uniref:2Fe-2S iron-sulfur cluster-binding protein n=1 Tax=Mesorhizobium sp. M0047 TaxID=2956859 RepID=UPI00333DF8D4
MPSVVFISSRGQRHELSFDRPTSAMQVARSHAVAGIEAECGGTLSCGTCHVYVDEADAGRVGAASQQESDMLDLVAAERTPTSRLCCQIELCDQLDGVVLHIPETQF